MARATSSSYRHGPAIFVFVAFAAVALLVWRLSLRGEAERIQAEFVRRAQSQASLAHERLRLYEEMLYSLRSVFIGQSSVSRGEFALAAAELLSRHKGVQALEWVGIVSAHERAAVEAQATRELSLPFTIRQREPGGRLQLASDSSEYFAILFVEPLAGNEPALGYDVLSAPTAPGLLRARTQRTLQVSPPFRLVQANGGADEAGVVFALPVFDPSATHSPVTGFVQGVFRVQTMLAQAHHFEGNEALHSFYLDRTDEHGARTEALLYANLAGREPMRQGITVTLPPLDRATDFHDAITMGGRTWSLVIAPDPAWVQRQKSSQPTVILAAGLTIAALLALFVHSLLSRTERVEREVTQRTGELRDSEARLQAILDHSPALIFVKDLNGQYVTFNYGLNRLCDRPSAAIRGRTDEELFPPQVAARYVATDRAALSAGQPMNFEETIGEGPHASTWLVQKFPLRDARGQCYALCGISTEITERKRAEVELQEHRRQLANLISQLPGAAFRCAFDDPLTASFASEGMLQLTGYSADDFVAGRVHLATIALAPDRPLLRQAVGSAVHERRSFEVEYRLLHRGGLERWVLVRGRPFFAPDGSLLFIEGLAIDVTALKHAEAEKLAFERNLQETQKLESLGVLAGGIAHDFNNLLTAILGNATLLNYTQAQTEASRTHIAQIENAARRAAELCSQMLAYAGKGRISSGPLDLSRLVQDTTGLLAISIGKNCALDLQLSPGLPSVSGDATQLRQIVMNLVINASDAIGERAGGKITVRTFEVSADAATFRTALRQPKLETGRYVGLEVHDNGSGMSAETMARIFEPFYTTKFSGRGLGLSAVLGIVHGHNGALFVESQPAVGSIFRLLLPASSALVVESPATPTTPSALHGTILIADDDEPVRNIVGKVLQQQGATVLLTRDGAEALRVYQTERNRIDLILLDLTMPGLTGEEILTELRTLGATQKIVIMSGYGEEETMKRFATLGVVAFISKPFELQDVVTRLRALLA